MVPEVVKTRPGVHRRLARRRRPHPRAGSEWRAGIDGSSAGAPNRGGDPGAERPRGVGPEEIGTACGESRRWE